MLVNGYLGKAVCRLIAGCVVKGWWINLPVMQFCGVIWSYLKAFYYLVVAG